MLDAPKVLMTEAESLVADKQVKLDKKNHKITKILLKHGASKQKIRKATDSLESGKSLGDFAWAYLNEQLQSEAGASNFDEMSNLYWGMREVLIAEGKPYSHIMKGLKQTELLRYKAQGVKKVKIIAAEDERTCESLLHKQGHEGDAIARL
jgi:hypothetical protein